MTISKKQRREILEMISEDDWRLDATCRTADLTGIDFFPLSGYYTSAARKAVEMCRSCPVSDPCLVYALKTKQVGIWGGKTERDRTRKRRKMLRDFF